jgi:small-conductance mechanosensitive channel
MIAVTVVFLALAVLIGYEWLQEHDARLKAEGVTSAQQQVIAEAQKSIDQAKADQTQVATALAQQIAGLEAQKQQPVTPAQFVVDLAKVLPNLPQPATVVQPPATQQTVNGKVQEVSSAPAVQIPAADLQALQAYKLTCDETGATLGACQRSSADLTTQLSGTHEQLNATIKERDSWETAAKGGTWKQRLGKSLKCAGFSAGGAYLGSLTKQSGTGAAAGAIVGQVGCSLF